MENKYFTLDTDDIRVGYEYESEEDPVSGIWERQIIENLYDLERCCRYMQKDPDCSYRVPYLTKEQAEKEFSERRGIKWTIIDDNGAFEGKYSKKGFEYEICWTSDELLYVHEDDACLYLGECKCINDFRLIIKLLGI